MVFLCKDLWKYIVLMKNWPYGKGGSQIPLLQLKGRNQHLICNSCPPPFPPSPVPGVAGHPFQTSAPALKRDEADSITAIKKQEGSGKDTSVYLGKEITLSSPIKARESAAAGLRGKHCLLRSRGV